MARKCVERLLPPLRKLFPGFRGFPKSGSRLSLVTKMLGEIARKLRKRNNQSFYSMREMAAFLSTALRTVELAYRNLENEGLIVRVRGSRTVLLGTLFKSHHPARNIISVPMNMVALHSFFARNFFYRISEELRRHHIVASQILFSLTELQSHEFARRLWDQADIVVWLFPSRNVKETILTLHDHGVQNILLNPIEQTFMPAHYLMDWTPAYREAICAWRAEGIRHVVVCWSTDVNSQKAINNFLGILQEHGCTYTLANGKISDLRDEVNKRSKRGARVGCAVLEYEVADQLCNREPVGIEQLTARCRVLFGRGIVHAPYFLDRKSRADVIGFSGDQVAIRVARDLSRGQWATSENPVRFIPRWMPKASLGEIFG